MTKLIILGSGIAAVQAAQAARAQDPDIQIDLYSSDTELPYYRLRLFELLVNPQQTGLLYIHPASWYDERQITLHLGVTATAVNTAAQTVILSTGHQAYYDELIVATGSRSMVPPIPGNALEGVCTLWTMQDALDIESRLREVTRAVVIGGGLLGLEAAYALARDGIDTTVIEFMPRLMMRQLDKEAARLFTRQVEAQGVRVVTSGDTDRILSDHGDRASGVRLKDGREFAADLVMISTGVQAAVESLVTSGIEIDRRIVVDDHMRTSIPHIYAAGDNAVIDHQWYGLWQVSMQQGRTAGTNAAGGEAVYHSEVPPYTMNTMGTRIASAGKIHDFDAGGDPLDTAGYREVVSQDEEQRTYRKLTYIDDKLAGYVLLGDVAGQPGLQKELTGR